MPKRDLQKCLFQSLLGGLIIYHYFTLGPNFFPLKKQYIFFGNQWKMAKYTVCQKIIYCPTFNAVLGICEGSQQQN